MGRNALSGKLSNSMHVVFACLLLISLWITNTPIQAALLQESAKEYQIKAVYLYNFSYFVSWRKEAFANAKSSFYYCILGENPFEKQLDLTVQDENVDGHAIKVKYLTDYKKSTSCQVVFISKSEINNLETILDFLHKNPVLTVSDIPEFIDKGGMIRFYTNRRRQVRIAIEPDTLKEADLGVSGNLLRISEIVRR